MGPCVSRFSEKECEDPATEMTAEVCAGRSRQDSAGTTVAGTFDGSLTKSLLASNQLPLSFRSLGEGAAGSSSSRSAPTPTPTPVKALPAPSTNPRRRGSKLFRSGKRRADTAPPAPTACDPRKFKRFAETHNLSVDLACMGAAPGNPATARPPRNLVLQQQQQQQVRERDTKSGPGEAKVAGKPHPIAVPARRRCSQRGTTAPQHLDCEVMRRL